MGCTLEHPNLWDVSLITDMSHLFQKDGLKDFNENISNWNVSNVTNMEEMFCHSKAFNQPIDKWDVSNVTDMNSMFYEAKSFKQTLPDEWKKKRNKLF